MCCKECHYVESWSKTDEPNGPDMKFGLSKVFVFLPL
jgi:hypothetical protein